MTHVNSSGPSRAPKSTCTMFAAFGVSMTPRSSAENSGPACKYRNRHSTVARYVIQKAPVGTLAKANWPVFADLGASITLSSSAENSGHACTYRHSHNNSLESNH
jgi:hypothetical protein